MECGKQSFLTINTFSNRQNCPLTKQKRALPERTHGDGESKSVKTGGSVMEQQRNSLAARRGNRGVK